MPLLLTDILDSQPIGCVSRNLSFSLSQLPSILASRHGEARPSLTMQR